MRVLITGVAGFIGGHLARRLLDEGDQVIGIDNLSSGVLENVDSRVEFHRADIRSNEIGSVFDGVDAVFHLAAKNCLVDCLQDPVETADVNVAGTVKVLHGAVAAGVRKVIYADTSAEYEGMTEFPSQVDSVAPLSVYALSKHAGALFCRGFQRLWGLRLTVLRYFNVYGPAQDWRRSVPPLMSAVIVRLLRGERPIIYGTGEKRRDFVYVSDVTDFNVLALRDPRTDGGVYNVGSGVNYSVNEVFAAVEGALRTGLRPIFEADQPGEAEITLADIRRETALGWRPRVGLREGLERSIAYVREHALG